MRAGYNYSSMPDRGALLSRICGASLHAGRWARSLASSSTPSTRYEVEAHEVYCEQTETAVGLHAAMTRTLENLGDNKGLVLTPAMLDHLGVCNEVEVVLEHGKIVLMAPCTGTTERRRSFDDAVASTLDRYGNTLRDLADAG